MTDKTLPTFNDLAPYPEDFETATAEDFARNYAVLAQANWTRAYCGTTPETRRDGIAWLLGMFPIVQLLRDLVTYAGAQAANEAARCLLEDLDAPEVMGPRIHEWLTEYGIDPEVVNVITRALPELPAEAAQSEMVTVRKDDLARYLNGDGSDLDAATAGLKRLWAAAGIEDGK